MPELNPPPEPRDTPGGERRIGAAVAAVLAAGALYLWKSPAGREDELRPSTGVVSIPEPAATPATSLTPPEKGDEGAYEDGELTYPGLLSALQRAARTGEERKSVRRLQTYFKSHHHTDELVKEFERRAADGKKPKPKASEFLKRLGSVPGAAQGIESFLSSPGTGALVVRALAQPGVRDALRAAAGEPSSAPTPSPGRPSFSAGDLVLLKRVFPNVPIFDAMAGGARPSGGGWGPIEFPAGGGGKTGETGSPGAPSPSPSLVPVPPTGPTKVVGEYRPGREPQDPTNPTPSPSPI
ncbi:MAG: hypothetical protein HY925_03350, partial [Elusimicrobia bacterium]|nr:hypothetical protein [Elusimicrobiota bacterium]